MSSPPAPRPVPRGASLLLLTPLLLPAASFAAPSTTLPRPRGPEHQEVDLIKPSKDFPRIYVQAILPDGEPGLFLVDTGADISVLSEDAANRLGLQVDRSWGMLSGLSGSTPMHRAVIDELRFGEVVVDDVEVAVGVPGVSGEVGFMGVDGLLGNNVWGRFSLEIDYPGATMGLHAPGTLKVPRRRAAPMHFDGRHVFTGAVVRTEGRPATEAQLVVQVDTGASGLTLCSATGQPFEHDTTEGLETLRGIGASETLPPFRFLESTRRIALDHVALGGRKVSPDAASARWVDFHDLRKPTCRAGMRALLGQEYLADYRVLIDYPTGTLALTRSRRKARTVNGHELLLERDREVYGADPTRGLQRAKYLLGMERDEEARERLRRFVDDREAGSPADAAEARVLLANVYRFEGDLEASWSMIDELTAGELVDQKQIVAAVNGLLFEDRPDEAMELARRAIDQRPEEGDAWVALADALLAHGVHGEAREALLEAARLEQYPDAHLLRRARVALASGDRFGSMAHIRKLLKLYPFGGHLLWFYALLVEGDGDQATFRADLGDAMARLHPHNQPFDFLVAAHRILGDEDQVDHYYSVGLEEHCAPMPSGPTADNCRAWYDALAGRHLDAALARINESLEAEGDRSDFLDTAAMVHLARGEVDLALAKARQAARMSPDDVYMLWQAERIADIAERSDLASVTPAGRTP